MADIILTEKELALLHAKLDWIADAVALAAAGQRPRSPSFYKQLQRDYKMIQDGFK